jgi:hypothetical protein
MPNEPRRRLLAQNHFPNIVHVGLKYALLLQCIDREREEGAVHQCFPKRMSAEVQPRASSMLGMGARSIHYILGGNSSCRRLKRGGPSKAGHRLERLQPASGVLQLTEPLSAFVGLCFSCQPHFLLSQHDCPLACFLFLHKFVFTSMVAIDQQRA